MNWRSTTGTWLRFLPVLALLAGASVLLHGQGGSGRSPQREEFTSFPTRIGDWTGTDVGIPRDIREVLGEGDFLERIYRRAGEPSIDLFLAYFPSQRTGSTIHSPRNCLPGAGWMPVSQTEIQLTSPATGPINVNRY